MRCYIPVTEPDVSNVDDSEAVDSDDYIVLISNASKIFSITVNNKFKLL